MINNNESRIRHAALYYGQKVIDHADYRYVTEPEYVCMDYEVFGDVEEGVCSLSLFDINSLSDEQLFEIANVLGYKDASVLEIVRSGQYHKPPYIAIKKDRRSFIQFDLKNNDWFMGNNSMSHLKVHQYLLSQSIALPFYCSIEKRVISVGEQIELGWIKIRTI